MDRHDDWVPVQVRLAWDDSDEWEEDLDQYLVNRSQTLPWSRGSHGKFLMSPEGEFHSWATNPAGEPHHDEVAEERGVNQVLKGDIAPSGAWWITDRLDPNADAEEWAQRVAPQAQKAGLQPIFRGYSAKVAVKLDTCDHCLKPYEECTCRDGGDWAVDPVADPVRDLKGPVQSFQRIVPEDRWAWTG